MEKESTPTKTNVIDLVNDDGVNILRFQAKLLKMYPELTEGQLNEVVRNLSEFGTIDQLRKRLPGALFEVTGRAIDKDDITMDVCTLFAIVVL